MESRDDGANILRIFNSAYRQSGEVKCCIPSTESDRQGQLCAYADLCVLPKAYVGACERQEIRREIERYGGSQQKLRFLHCLQDEVVLQGDDVIIEACYQGQPPAELRWKRSVSKVCWNAVFYPVRPTAHSCMPKNSSISLMSDHGFGKGATS